MSSLSFADEVYIPILQSSFDYSLECYNIVP